MGKIKGFLFAVRHREILMTDLGLTRGSNPTPPTAVSGRVAPSGFCCACGNANKREHLKGSSLGHSTSMSLTPSSDEFPSTWNNLTRSIYLVLVIAPLVLPIIVAISEGLKA